MANSYNNKVVRASGDAQIDLTGDTADAAHLAAGYTTHDKSGTAITGTASWRYDASTEELTVPSWALEVE